MAGLIHRGFNGLNPYQDPELLAENFAQVAKNVRLINGDIKPARQETDVTTVFKFDPQTIYRFGQDSPTDTNFWFTFEGDVDVVRGAIDEDTTERTYFTGMDYPRVTNSELALQASAGDFPSVSYRLGIPSPSLAPIATIADRTDPPPMDANEVEFAVVYLVTYVSGFQEEGAGSPPSNIAMLRYSQQFIRLTNLPTAPVGNYNITKKRIYRSALGTSNSVFRFVAEVPVGQTTYDDYKIDSELGETFATGDYLPPPDGMRGLTVMANGIFSGFLNQTLYFSPVFVPYAYPVRYQLSVDAKIVGIKAFNQSLFVGTTANPYIITGLDPDALPQNKLAINQALASKRSMVAMMGGVVYASPDGVCMATESDVKILTERILTRKQWQEYKPSSMHCHQINNEYIVFYDTGIKKGHLIFDFTGKQALMTEGDSWFPSAYNDRLFDNLYVADKNKIKKWDSGGTKLATWRSKKYRFPLNKGFSRGQVLADEYVDSVFIDEMLSTLFINDIGDTLGGSPSDIKMNVYVDNRLHFSKTVESEKPFPIPLKHGILWEIEVQTGSPVKSFTVAESQSEIT